MKTTPKKETRLNKKSTSFIETGSTPTKQLKAEEKIEIVRLSKSKVLALKINGKIVCKINANDYNEFVTDFNKDTSHLHGGILIAPKSYWVLKNNKNLNCQKFIDQCGTKSYADYVPNDIFGIDISEACNIHDWMYIIGKHITNKQEKTMYKEKAESLFARNLFELINKKNDYNDSLTISSPISWIQTLLGKNFPLKKFLRLTLALIFCTAASTFGHSYYFENEYKIKK